MLKVSWEKRQTRSTERNGRINYVSDTDDKVDLDKAIYLIGNQGSLVAYYRGGDTEDPDERLEKIRQSSTRSYLDLRPKKE